MAEMPNEILGRLYGMCRRHGMNPIVEWLPIRPGYITLTTQGTPEQLETLLAHKNAGISPETVLERVRTVLAAHNGETLDTYTAGIIEVEIIQSIAKPKEEAPMANDETNRPFEEDEDGIITLTDEEGNEHEFTIVQLIKVADKEYAVLCQVTAEGAVDDEAGEVVILRIDQENGEDVLVEIEDEDEFARVSEAWDDLLDEEEEDADGDPAQ